MFGRSYDSGFDIDGAIFCFDIVKGDWEHSVFTESLLGWHVDIDVHHDERKNY